MSQNSVILPTTGTVSGLQMTQDTNNALDTLRTNFSGASFTVSSAEPWQFFANTTNNTLNMLSADGTTFIPLFTFNQSSYLATPYNLSQSFAPQGRLTLSPSSPVQSGNITGNTYINYTPYIGNLIPIYNGSIFVNTGFATITLNLNSSNHPNAQVFDVYASLQSSVVTLSAMAWGNNSSRTTSSGGKTGTGNSTITQVNGLWVNNAAISSGDSFNGSTGYSIPQYQGTYLGSFYTTANGQTGISLKPAFSSGGNNTIIGISNAYNRVKASALSADSTIDWTYSSAAWRSANASNSNRVSWVDGLAQTFVNGTYDVAVAFGSNGNNYSIGIALNGTGSPDLIAHAVAASTDTLVMVQTENFAPNLGLNFIQAVEYSGSGTQTAYGNGYMALIWDGEI